MVQETSLEGVVERIVFSNEENGWTVLRLMVRGKGEVSGVGNLFGLRPGESVRLEGKWVNDRKFGRQFRAESYLTVAPNTFTGIERYLGSGLVPGIGPTIAKRLVQHFGLDTLEVIDKYPERLEEVEGIGKVRLRRISSAWREQREIKDVMVFLQSHDVSPSHAVKIYKLYGNEAVTLVRNDPYRLSRDIWGIGFRTADRIAHSLGIARDAPQRLAAGVVHTLVQATDAGHCYQPRQRLVDNAAELLEADSTKVSEAIDTLVDEGDLSAVTIGLRPSTSPGQRQSSSTELSPETALTSRDLAIYLTPIERAEDRLAHRLRQLTAQGTLPMKLDVERAVRWFEGQEKIELAPGQRRALEQALTTKVLVLTGGPGTGKTTLVRGIVAILAKKKLRIELAAPTGRAAKRLGEATGREARTVHRLLEYSPQERGFSRNAENPLAVDLLVVDEASMLDTTLARHLLEAVPTQARLIVVGDVDQLPSIGAGRVLADLIDSGVIDVARLDRIFRQARESLIVTNAHRIRIGDKPMGSAAEDGDFFIIERDEPEAILQTLDHLVEQRIPRSFGFDPMADIQILTPMRRGLLGTLHLNATLQASLNPDGEEIPLGGRLLRTGDRVMQRRNNYDLEVWNGDIGRVQSYDADEQRVTVDFEGRIVRYEATELDELVLAYACSIHKSQGSEYPCVVIPLHTQHFTMLQRNLLYTAVTRGRKLVIIVGSARAIEIAIRTQTSGRRYTLLTDRLRG